MFNTTTDMFRKLLLSGSVLLCGALPAQAQTLESAVGNALISHPSAEAALATLNATKETEREAYSRYFPQISANASFGRMYGDNATSRGLSVTRGNGYSYLGEGSLSVSQLIFDGMETPNRVDAAAARAQSAGADILDVRESLAYRAVQSYVDVMRTQRGLSMITDHSALVDDYLGRIAEMVDDGVSDETELQQARDISVILKGIKAEYEGQAQAAMARLSEVTGAQPPEIMNEPPSQVSAIAQNMGVAIAKAKAEHPAVISAKLQAEASSYEVDAEKGTLYPDVNGELSYLKSDKDDVIGGEVVDARAVVRMSWNFSTGGEQFARIRRSKYSHKEAQARMQEIQRQIEQNVKLAYNEYSTSARQLELLGQRQELNEKLFATYQSQFEGARVNLLQLMQAHNQLFNTNLESVNGHYRYLAAQYGVLASMGQLQNTMNVQSPAKVSSLTHEQK